MLCFNVCHFTLIVLICTRYKNVEITTPLNPSKLRSISPKLPAEGEIEESCTVGGNGIPLFLWRLCYAFHTTATGALSRVPFCISMHEVHAIHVYVYGLRDQYHISRAQHCTTRFISKSVSSYTLRHYWESSPTITVMRASRIPALEFDSISNNWQLSLLSEATVFCLEVTFSALSMVMRASLAEWHHIKLRGN